MKQYKVWYINTDGKETIEGNFDTYEQADAYARQIEAEGKVHEDCMMAEGARAFGGYGEED